jgi:hypothetical protein
MRRSWGWRETYGSEGDEGGFAGDGGKRQVRQAVNWAHKHCLQPGPITDSDIFPSRKVRVPPCICSLLLTF